MVKYKQQRLTLIFMALSDATRRTILTRLTKREYTVSELAEPFDISLPAISKHLKILESAGLLLRRKEGRTYWCRLNPQPMREAADWLTKYRIFWEKQFDSLENYLQNNQDKEEK